MSLHDDDDAATHTLPPIPALPRDRFHVADDLPLPDGERCGRWVVLDREPPGRIVACFYRSREARAYARLRSDLHRKDNPESGPELLGSPQQLPTKVTFDIVTGLGRMQREDGET